MTRCGNRSFSPRQIADNIRRGRMTLCGLLAILILLVLIVAFLCGKRRREGFSAGPTSPYCTDTGKPFCTSQHDCVACLSDADCGSNLHCSTSGVCVTCVDDANCGPGEYCRNNQCTPCDTDDDCKNAGTGKVCDTSDPGHHLCLQCAQDGDCPPLHKCMAGACIGTCTQDSDCPSTMPTCVVQDGQGLCTACTQDGDCATWTPSTPHCARGLCVECVANSQCPVNPGDPAQANLRMCAGSICVQCGGATPAEADQYCVANYPATPYCAGVVTQGGPTQLCVQCRSDNHCTDPAAPHCLNGQCVGCVSDGDCGEGQHCGAGKQVRDLRRDARVLSGLHLRRARAVRPVRVRGRLRHADRRQDPLPHQHKQLRGVQGRQRLPERPLQHRPRVLRPVPNQCSVRGFHLALQPVARRKRQVRPVR